MASLYIWSPPAPPAAAGGAASGGVGAGLRAAAWAPPARPRSAAATALLHLVESVLVIRLHLLELLLELLVAVLELLDLAGQHGDRLLQLVEPVLDMDRVDALGAGRRRQDERDREQRGYGSIFMAADSFCAKAAIFRHGRFASKRKRRS